MACSRDSRVGPHERLVRIRPKQTRSGDGPKWCSATWSDLMNCGGLRSLAMRSDAPHVVSPNRGSPPSRGSSRAAER